MRTKAVSIGLALLALLVFAAGLFALVAEAKPSLSVLIPASNLDFVQAPPLANEPYGPDCEPNWYMVSSPNVGTVDNYLFAVAAVSGSDVWATGFYYSGSANVTLIEHWNGSAWGVVPSPNVGTYENYLKGVAAISGNDVWSVGEYRTNASYQTLIEHWNGTAWGVVPSPNVNTDENILYGVAAVSGSDVWAVGHCDCVYSGIADTLVEHWDGNAWSIVSSPNMGPSDNNLYAVVVVGSNDVWAAGDYYTPYLGTKTLLEHWDGSAWSIVPSPNVDPNDNELYGLAAVGSDNVWTVGKYGGGSGIGTLIEHWDGNAWSVIPSPNVGPSNALGRLAAVASGDIWAVGDWRDSSYVYHTLAEHWNGNAWSVVPSSDVGPSGSAFSEVAAVSSSDMWAVGNYYQNGTVYQTLVEHYSGVCISPTPTPIPTACAIQFMDVPVGSTFYPYVRCLACLGVINGYPDGTFKPNNPVTRGQLSKIVSNSAGFSDTTAGQQFQDVPMSSVFYPYIYRLVHRGYMSGYPCGAANEPCVPPSNLPYLRPNADATRGQIAKIDANAAGISNPPSGQQLQDVPVGSTYYTYTYRLVSRSIMGGYPCGGANEPCVPPTNLPYFRPNNNATRGQTSKLVANTFFPDCQTPEKP
jgi:hypothetical protein